MPFLTFAFFTNHGSPERIAVSTRTTTTAARVGLLQARLKALSSWSQNRLLRLVALAFSFVVLMQSAQSVGKRFISTAYLKAPSSGLIDLL